MGSDYLFILRDTNKSISPMAHPFGQIPYREGHAKRRLHKQRGCCKMKVLQQPTFCAYGSFSSVFVDCYLRKRVEYLNYGTAKLTVSVLAVCLWKTFRFLFPTHFFLGIMGFQPSFLLLHPPLFEVEPQRQKQ